MVSWSRAPTSTRANTFPGAPSAGAFVNCAAPLRGLVTFDNANVCTQGVTTGANISRVRTDYTNGPDVDTSGIDLLNMEASVILQSFAGASGTLAAIALKQQGIHPEGTAIIDPLTGQPAAFLSPNEYRTDEGLQPGTLPWEVAGIGGPLCSTADIGGNPYPRGQDQILVPGASAPVARPATRKEALPGCHRKWVDKVNGYLNLAWGTPEYMTGPNGRLFRWAHGSGLVLVGMPSGGGV